MSGLTEGQWYDFKVVRIIDLPSDNKKYFVLKNKDNNRFLLPYEFYENYNLRNNQWIRCRVDKINCVGSYFLEPEHPVYKEKEVFEFALDKIIEVFDINNDKEYQYFLLDEFNNSLSFTSTLLMKDAYNQKSISCVVNKIRKGKIYLGLPSQTNNLIGFSEGKIYPFKILDYPIKGKQEKEIILEDSRGKKHIISNEDYKDYKLKPGETVNCLIRKSHSRSRLVPEPENPVYKIGSCYYFKISKIESSVDYFGNKKSVLLVMDEFDNEIKIPLHKKLKLDKLIGKYILCQVTLFKNGRIYLKNMEEILDKKL